MSKILRLESVSLEELIHCFQFDFENGKVFWRVNNSQRDLAGKEAGYLDRTGGKLNWFISFKNQRVKRCKLIFYAFHERVQESTLAHVNKNYLDDRPSNLKEVEIISPAEIFGDSYIPEPNSGCWLWLSTVIGNYGTITINKRRVGAHRYSWFLHHGEIPIGLCVCHKCDNKLCVNPSHLFLGTHKDNMHDMLNKRGNRNFSRLKNENVLEIFNSNESPAILAKKFNLKPPAIKKIQNSESWTHLTKQLTRPSQEGR